MTQVEPGRWRGKMRIWGEALVNDLICWFLASMRVVRVWQPVLDSFRNGV